MGLALLPDCQVAPFLREDGNMGDRVCFCSTPVVLSVDSDVKATHVTVLAHITLTSASIP